MGAARLPLGHEHLWTPVGAGVKSEQELDALVLCLMADSAEGWEHARGSDETIAAVPGLEGLTIVQDYIADAARRARERPGWAGVPTRPERRPDQAPPPRHRRASIEARRDVMPATSAVKRREEERMAERLRTQPAEARARRGWRAETPPAARPDVRGGGGPCSSRRPPLRAPPP